MVITKPDMSQGVWAENGNIEVPSSEKIEQGWIIEKPLNEWMNWLQNRQDKMLAYLNQRGIAEWDTSTDYPQFALVSRAGKVYQAISQNTDKDPTLNTSIWELAFPTRNEYLDTLGKVNNILNTDGYVSHYVKKSDPILNAAAKGVAYNNKTNKSGMYFEAEVPKIKSNGVTVAEFSGTRNPKDVVTWEQLSLAVQNYKVGDIYITTANGYPKDRLGYGEWERFGKGRTLVGFSDEISNEVPEWVKRAGDEFGEFDTTLSERNLPPEGFKLNEAGYFGAREHGGGGIVYASADQKPLNFKSLAKEDTGWLGESFNNVQPSITVYFWTRIS